MNSNNLEMENLNEISKALTNMDESEIRRFLEEILTSSEVSTLAKRWRIMKMLSQGVSQREIAKKLNVSLCKVTRGAKILKDEQSVSRNLIQGVNND
jgi:TrpR family trp operon transcriptional repressor